MYIKRVTIENVRRFASGAQQGVDLKLPACGWIVLAGPNGTGKTTMLECIGKALLPSHPNSLAELFGWLRHGAPRAQTRLELAVTSDDDDFVREAEDLSDRGPLDDLVVGDEWEPVYGAMSHGRESQGNRALNGPWASSRNGWFAAGYGAQRRIAGHSDEASAWSEGTERHESFATLFREDASLGHPIRWLMDLDHQSLDGDQTDQARREARQTIETVLAFVNDGLLPQGFSAEGVSSRGLRMRARMGSTSVCGSLGRACGRWSRWSSTCCGTRPGGFPASS